MQTLDSWTWTVCNLPIRQLGQGNQPNPATWSLKPAITLLHPQGNGPDPIINVSIESEKSFQFSEDIGWNWHKSWKLPTVSLQLELIDPDTKDLLLCPNDIYVQIFAVKASLDENKKLCLTDVGLKGTTKMELVDGKGVFQTLKFCSTSYNNEGVKFHLVMCVYLQVSEDTPPKVLKAVISPPIFVDSRKSVRDSEKITENKLYIYTNPFSPDNFTKRFVKRETKKKESIEEDIQNNIEGLCSYLTAPNIRNKVKHPIFLTIRFSSCVSFYYNSNVLDKEKEKNYIDTMHDLLFEDIEKANHIKDVKLDESSFLICIDIQALEDKSKKKKISESLNAVRCKSLSVVFSKSDVPANFVQLTKLDSMMESYSKSYSKIAKRAKILLQDDDNEEEDGPTDRLPPPDKQVINFREQKAPKRNDWHRYFDLCVPEDILQKKVKTENNSQSPSTMVESTSRPRINPEPVIQVRKPDPVELPRPTLVQTKSSEQHIQVPANQNVQGQIFLGLLQNKLGYAANIPQQQQIVYAPINTQFIGNNIMSPLQLVNTTSSFPAMPQINVGNIGMNIALPYQALKIPETKIDSMYRMIPNGGVNPMEQLDIGNHLQKQITLQGLKQVTDGLSTGMPTLIQNIKKDESPKKYQTKPLLLQYQGQVLEGETMKTKTPLQLGKRERMETENNFNDIKVKNEGL